LEKEIKGNKGWKEFKKRGTISGVKASRQDEWGRSKDPKISLGWLII